MDIKSYISSGIIELYVMGMCSVEEEKELEVLRQQHPELDAAIIQYEKELEENMLKNVTLPSTATDEKILKQLNALQTPVVAINRNKKKNTFHWWKTAAAAAVALLLISAYFNYNLYNKTKQQEKQLVTTKEAGLPESDYAILNTPSITPVAMYGVGIHAICRCTMFWDKRTNKMYVMIHHLIKSPSSKNYQLWAMVDGKPVSVGIMDDSIRGRFIELENVPTGAVAFSVTLEKAGGSQQPTENETWLKGSI